MSIANRRLTVLLVCSLIALAGSLQLKCGKRKTPELYEIQDGYRGWVEIKFLRARCPPLPSRGGTTIFTIGANGKLCTSSQLQFGLGTEEYWYVNGAKRTRLTFSPADPSSMIWSSNYYGNSGRGVGHEDTRDRRVFFVGTKAEFDGRRDDGPMDAGER